MNITKQELKMLAEIISDKLGECNEDTGDYIIERGWIDERMIEGWINQCIEETNKTKDYTIEEFDWSVKVYNSLKRHGINDISQLCSMEKSDVISIMGSNGKYLYEIESILEQNGLKLYTNNEIQLLTTRNPNSKLDTKEIIK